MRLRLTSLLLFAATAFSGAAWAQTDVVAINQPTIEIATGNSSAFNEATCKNPTGGTAVIYNFPAQASYGAVKLEVFITDQNSCPDTAGSNDTSLLEETLITQNNQSDTLSVYAKDLMEDCPSNTTKTFRVCAVSRVLSTDMYGSAGEYKVAYKESVTVTYDSVQPAPPVITSTSAGDSAVSFVWAAQDDIQRWIIYYRPNGPAPQNTGDICGSVSSAGSALTSCWTPEGVDAACIQIVCDDQDANCVPADATAAGKDAGPSWDASPSFDPALVGDGSVWSQVIVEDNDNNVANGRVGGLVNDQQYQFVLVAVDLAGNVSAGSAPVNATPVVVHDFYRRYQCAGGNEKGGFGCSTTGMAVLVPAAGLVVLGLIRRRRQS